MLATFAGGCFWCTQHDFDKVQGVISTQAGYLGGHVKNPTYEEVCTGRTGHVEAVQIEYDPERISYEELLQIYWKSIDPTRSDGQFCDIGTQYRPVIFYHTKEQQEIAERSKNELLKEQHVAVDILPVSTFYPAEEYHQQFYKKSPARYQSYHNNSGRL